MNRPMQGLRDHGLNSPAKPRLPAAAAPPQIGGRFFASIEVLRQAVTGTVARRAYAAGE
jgi:hypothetical protein